MPSCPPIDHRPEPPSRVAGAVTAVLLAIATAVLAGLLIAGEPARGHEVFAAPPVATR